MAGPTHARRHRLVATLGAAALVSLLLPTASMAAPLPTAATIDAQAQCHGKRCFVSIAFSARRAGTATVSVGAAERTLRIAAGRSTRIVEFTRKQLAAAPVVVRHGDRTRTVRTSMTALAVNSVANRCATLEPTDAYLNVGPASAFESSISLPASGNLGAAVIFADFPDAAGVGNPHTTRDPWIAQGIAHLKRSSYGRFRVVVKDSTSGWVRMPSAASTYNPMTYETHRDYLQDAIDAADAEIDFTGVDLILVMVSDSAGKSGSQAFRGLIDSLDTDEGPRHVGITYGSDVMAAPGVTFSHEIAHTLGLPDLYDLGGEGDLLYAFTGRWDFMSNSWITPTDLLAWQKSKLGWLDPGQTLCAPEGTTNVRLAPLTTTGGVKAVFVRTGPHTGVVVENRQAIGNDSSVCREGALVYTVDSRIKTLEGPIRVAGGSKTGVGCGIGPRSDATLRPGQSRTVAGVTVTVVGSVKDTIEVTVSH